MVWHPINFFGREGAIFLAQVFRPEPDQRSPAGIDDPQGERTPVGVVYDCPF
jgi:hypothetical protein